MTTHLPPTPKPPAPTPPNRLTRAKAAARLLLVREAEASFLAFVQLHHPEYKLQPFHLDLIARLDALAKGTLTHPETNQTVRNLIVNMPPRHGKSAICTWLFPIWYMGLGRARQVMVSSYNSELAIDFGRRSRTYLSAPTTTQVFPHLVLKSDTRAAEDWNTTDGGRYVGVGLDGTTTGRAANLLVIDDPLKNRADAESAAKRNRVWSFYTSALSSRLQPTIEGDAPIQLVILTRWHPDDLAGRLQQTDEFINGHWFQVSYSAITETPDGPAPLWPERFSLEWLEGRRALDPREFESLYQQQPYIQGGNIFKADWWRTYDPELNHSYASVIITADTAFKTSSRNDYSVFCVAGLTTNGEMHILAVHRERLDFPSAKAKLVTLNALYRPLGLRAVYIEDKASGQSLIQELRRDTGMSVVPYKVTHDKTARASSVSPLVEGGRVHLPTDAPWLSTFKLELAQFPDSPHDDQVDAFTMALDILSRQSTGFAPDTPLSDSLNNRFTQYGKSLASILGMSSNYRALGR